MRSLVEVVMQLKSVGFRSVVLLALCSAPAFTTAGGQEPKDTAKVEGIITRAGSGEPIPGVKVTLIFIPPPAPRQQPSGGGGVGMVRDGVSISSLPPTITSSAPAFAASAGQAPPPSSIP